MGAVKTQELQPVDFPHPNEFDRRRIEKMLQARKRYRYVSPRVVAIAGGYRIESPCCSRNVDQDGGVVDVALLLYSGEQPGWRLCRKDHVSGDWHVDAAFHRLDEMLERLNADPDRQFWQ